MERGDSGESGVLAKEILKEQSGRCARERSRKIKADKLVSLLKEASVEW